MALTVRFHDDLSTPGLRLPLTADQKTFAEAVELSRSTIWLHTFGEGMTLFRKESGTVMVMAWYCAKVSMW